jgi:hypothetical protein
MTAQKNEESDPSYLPGRSGLPEHRHREGRRRPSFGIGEGFQDIDDKKGGLNRLSQSDDRSENEDFPSKTKKYQDFFLP